METILAKKIDNEQQLGLILENQGYSIEEFPDLFSEIEGKYILANLILSDSDFSRYGFNPNIDWDSINESEYYFLDSQGIQKRKGKIALSEKNEKIAMICKKEFNKIKRIGKSLEIGNLNIEISDSRMIIAGSIPQKKFAELIESENKKSDSWIHKKGEKDSANMKLKNYLINNQIKKGFQKYILDCGNLNIRIIGNDFVFDSRPKLAEPEPEPEPATEQETPKSAKKKNQK